MTHVHLSPRWAVNAEARVTLEASQDQAWAVMQHFGRFISADPYHTRVTDCQGARIDGLPKRGADLHIGHGVGVTLFDRVGKLIRVVPGTGYAFTDQSKRGATVGFPHIYAYMLKPIDERTCELALKVRGRWSARWLPRGLVKCWLWWVMLQAQWLMRAHMAYEIDRTRQQLAKERRNASLGKVDKQ